MDLGFLSNIQLNEPASSKVVASRATAPKLPEGNCIRIFGSGKAYPSAALVAAFDLEYRNKGVEGGFAFDVFKSVNWAMFPESSPELIFCAAVPKGTPKADLFSACGHDKDTGVPTKTVTEQGGGSFAKELLAMVGEVYGKTAEKGGYIDIEIVIASALPARQDGIYYIPKVVSRGSNKGSLDVVRRENINIWPIVVVDGTGVDLKTDESAESTDGSQAPESDASVPEVAVAAQPAVVVPEPVPVVAPVAAASAPAPKAVVAAAPVAAPVTAAAPINIPETAEALVAPVQPVVDPLTTQFTDEDRGDSAAAAAMPVGMPPMPDLSKISQ